MASRIRLTHVVVSKQLLVNTALDWVLTHLVEGFFTGEEFRDPPT